MLRPLLTLAAVGAVGYILWQLLWGLLLPIVGVAVGLLAVAIKFAFLALLLFIAWKLLRKLTREPA
jgi:uncharacterized membrane protein